MVSFQINKDTKEIALESYKGEILESLQNHQDVSWAIQSRFLDQRRLFRSFVQSFKWFYEILQTFKNSGRKKTGKMLQPQVNSRNPSAVHHNLLKLCSIDNRQWFGDVRYSLHQDRNWVSYKIQMNPT